MEKGRFSGKDFKSCVVPSQKKTGWLQWVVPLLAAFLCSYLCCQLGIRNYLTNDDVNIQDYLSGQYTGSPFFGHPYIHVFLGWFISGLYRLIPGIEWWYVYSQGVMFLGIVMINVSISYMMWKYDRPIMMGVLLTILTDGCMLCYPLCRTAFTVVPAILGTGVLSLFLTFYHTRAKKTVCIACYILFVVAYCHRSATGLALTCYYLLAVLYCCLSGDGKWYKRAGAFILTALLLIGTMAGLKTVNNRYQEKINGREYRDFNSARSEYWDYPHDSYDENPAIYEQAGWSRETLWLVNQGCLMDERVTTENLRYIIQNSAKGKNRSTPKTMRKTFLELQKEDMVQPTEWFWTLVSAGTLAAILFRRDFRMLLFFLANIAGTFILIMYQLYGGRILYRTLVICLLPSAVMNLLWLIRCLDEKEHRRSHYVLTGILTVAGIIVFLNIIPVTFSREVRDTDYIRKQKAAALGRYAESHPENIYIRDTRSVKDLDPDVLRPVNLIEWGRYDWNSAANKIRLRMNGIEKLTGEVMKRPNVFFISTMDIEAKARDAKRAASTNRSAHFYFWLKQEYGAVGIRQVDQIGDDLYVYQFVFDDSVSDELYYDILDNRNVVLIDNRS